MATPEDLKRSHRRGRTEAPSWLREEHAQQAQELWAQALEEEKVPVTHWLQAEKKAHTYAYAEYKPTGPEETLVKTFKSLAEFIFYEGQSMSQAVIHLLDHAEYWRYLAVVFQDSQKWRDPIWAVESLRQLEDDIVFEIEQEIARRNKKSN